MSNLGILSSCEVRSKDPDGVDGGDSVDDLSVAGGGDESHAVDAIDEVGQDRRRLDPHARWVRLQFKVLFIILVFLRQENG